MKQSDKLIKRIRSELIPELPVNVEIKRTYAKANGLRSGAFSWFLYCKNHAWVTDYGSTVPVTELLRANKLYMISYHNGHFDILPQNHQ
jgi:hypothetical protein